MTKIRAGIIGCGQIAGGYNIKCKEGESLTHACSYNQIKDVVLVAICDPNKDARNLFGEKWKVDKIYSTHEEMLFHENLDIVSICSPTEYHLDAFRAISKTDSIKGIFCEKPLSYDLSEARKIVELAEGKVVSVNYFRRWNPTLKNLKKDLNENKYGSINYITVRYTKGLLTNCSHLVDLLYWMFGSPNHIEKYQTHQVNSNDPGVDFKLSFMNGLDAVFLHIPVTLYTYIEVDIHTDMGKISIKQRGQQITLSEIISAPSFNNVNILNQKQIIDTDWRDCPTRAIKELIDVVQNGGKLSCTINDGLRVSEICDSVIRAD